MNTPVDLMPEVEKFLQEPRKMLIDGEWVEAASGKMFETADPATGEMLT